MGKITWQRRGPFLYTAGILCDVKGRRGRSSNSPCMALKVYYVILKVKKEINQIVWRHKNKKKFKHFNLNDEWLELFRIKYKISFLLFFIQINIDGIQK